MLGQVPTYSFSTAANDTGLFNFRGIRRSTTVRGISLPAHRSRFGFVSKVFDAAKVFVFSATPVKAFAVRSMATASPPHGINFEAHRPVVAVGTEWCAAIRAQAGIAMQKAAMPSMLPSLRPPLSTSSSL
jgi:hypothetical protein